MTKWRARDGGQGWGLSLEALDELEGQPLAARDVAEHLVAPGRRGGGLEFGRREDVRRFDLVDRQVARSVAVKLAVAEDAPPAGDRLHQHRDMLLEVPLVIVLDHV